MAWFRRRRTTWSGLVFASDEALEQWRRKLAEAELTYLGEERRSGNIYRTFRGNDPEKAKRFLRGEPVDRDNLYLVVETPDGTWGTDSNALYLEQLRPWQRHVDNADCTGQITALIDGLHNLRFAARGIVDNYAVEVTCGRCRHEWIDGIRYRNATLVRCPACRATNRVDSSNITATAFP